MAPLLTRRSKGGNRGGVGSLALPIRPNSISPPREPAFFAALRRRVFYAASQYSISGKPEFRERRSISHCFQNLKQSPTLAMIALGRERAFTFEIDIVDQGIRP